jgi:integrase
MTTSALDVGDRVARQALVEKPEYVSSDDDLSPIFGISSTPEVVTLRSQYFVWMDELKARAYDKPSPATLATFTSRAKTVLSLAGNIPLAAFGNAAMKKFVQDCAHFDWSPSTLADHMLIVKLIIASAVNEEGDPLHPRAWNRRFVNAPAVETTKQKRFVFTRDHIEALFREAKSSQERLFYAVSAGTGMRLGEMRSIRVRGNNPKQTSWEPGKIRVRTTMFKNDETGRTKTDSGKRTVYLHSSLDQMITSFAKDIESGAFLFQSKCGQPMKASTIAYRITKIIPGGSHHGFRRYHISHCRHERMLEELLKLRVGHSSSDITSIYSHQSEEVQAQAAEDVGLGFEVEGTKS